MFLLYLVFTPLAVALLILLCANTKQVKLVALAGAAVQLAMAVALLFQYHAERVTGNSAQMLFEYRTVWFAPLGIQYYVGVDGISVAMILLTVCVVLAGVLVSWNVEKLTKEFFFLLMLLSAVRTASLFRWICLLCSSFWRLL